MASFAVEFLLPAEDDLARIWLAAPDPDEVTRADATAEQLLSSDPAGRGVHLAEGLYRLTVAPLVLYYAIDDDRKLVRVASIGEVR
ncbi:MAG TPA: type II toxin-antitoxin system RelE/ParE family toxin [Fimbriiglobus sp.]|nr:type II toxin-antitoxin system RelE/ParE family toxin [Fimbriiglobus sp.]